MANDAHFSDSIEPAADADLADTVATTRYVAFSLMDAGRTPLQDGSRCPHCDGVRVQKWGSFSGRQRYRCRDCGRTFSTFTGTPLHYLKRPDLWRLWLWCHDSRLSVRAAGEALGVDKNTAWRWRHRLRDATRVI